MKLINATLCVMLIGAVTARAQTSETVTKSKITVEDGKSVTVTGCVASSPTGEGFVLTNVADKTGALHDYILVSANGKLSKHVGHRVQVHGKVSDRGDAKVKIETKTKSEGELDHREMHSHAEHEGDVVGPPYLGVKSMKMIAASCP